MKKIGFVLTALVLVAVCFILLPTEAKAASESDLTFTLNSDGQSYSVTDCSDDASGALVIPSTYNGLPVTGIGDSAFSWCTSLTGVTIPDSVTSIGSSAFSGCTSLTSVTIPDSVTSIGSSAFYGCSKLTSVIIPDSVTSIGSSAFRNCTGLTSVTIPDSVTSIGSGAFSGCSSLKSITIPFVGGSRNSTSTFGYIFGTTSYTGGTATKQFDYGSTSDTAFTTYYIPTSLKSVTVTGGEILDGAFYNCSGLTTVTIPDNVTSIGAGAFFHCSKLTSVTIPDSVTSIGNNAFWNCTSLTSVTIGNGVTSIGSSAFENCTKLTSVTIPDSVTSIGYRAFHNCTRLTSVTIPDSVTSIGYNAFYYCTSLSSVTIPNSVTSIGDRAFYNCLSLTRVIYCGTEEQWNSISIETNNTKLTSAKRQYHAPSTADICTEDQVCTICGDVLAEASGHNWTEATTSAPKTCKVCGATEGEPLPSVTIPTVEVNNGKVTVFGEYESVRVIYIGYETLDPANTVWNDLLTVGKRYPDVNTSGGYRTFNAPANPSLKTDGNYILRVIYTNDAGKRVGVNYAVTFKAPVPTISVDSNGNISTQGTYYKIRIVYIANETFDITNTDWAALKAVGLKYASVNGVNGYRNYRHNLKIPGNYIIRMVYVGLDGSLLSVNYPVYFEAPTEAEAPTVSVDGTGNMTVTGVYSKIRVVYVGKTGFDVNNLDWNALKNAGLKYTDVNGAYGYRDYLVDLKKEGNYIVRFIYNDAEGNEVTVNYAMTFTADVPGITVNADGSITVKDRYEKIRMVYIANEKFDLDGNWNTLKKLGLKYTAENTANGYRSRLYTMKWEGTYIVRVIYYQPRHGNITVNYEVNFEG